NALIRCMVASLLWKPFRQGSARASSPRGMGSLAEKRHRVSLLGQASSEREEPDALSVGPCGGASRQVSAFLLPGELHGRGLRWLRRRREDDLVAERLRADRRRGVELLRHALLGQR